MNQAKESITVEDIYKMNQFLLGKGSYHIVMNDGVFEYIPMGNVTWDQEKQRFISRTIYDDNGRLIKRNW